MTDIFLEKQVRKLSFAVILVDDYSGKDPIGKVNLSLKDKKVKPIITPSSYYAFIDLPPEIYTVQVTNDYYFDSNLTLDLKSGQFDPGIPFVIKLKPNPAYPFPFGATLVRGMLWDSDDPMTRKTIASADISGECSGINFKLETETTEKGEFVFYFNQNEIKKNKINEQIMEISFGAVKGSCTVIESEIKKIDVPILNE